MRKNYEAWYNTMMNFWQTLPKPFLVQAPMDDVTDMVFRQIIAKAGKPDVFFTEFTSTDGMCSKGRKHIEHRLLYTDVERPIVAQIWGNKPENYAKTVEILNGMKFDGIDINMGCPVKDVVKRGQCSALILNHQLAGELIKAAIDAAGNTPVSVKTRIGFSKIQTEEWFSFLLGFPLAAITVHGRTAAEMSKVPAHWDEIGKVVKLRNKLNPQTLIIGNGDVKSRNEALEKAEQYGLDGIMIGRGIFENLWIFNPEKDVDTIMPTEKLEMLQQHIQLFVKTWGKTKSYEVLKKFYKMYTSGMEDASELRTQLMQFHSPEETLEYLKHLS